MNEPRVGDVRYAFHATHEIEPIRLTYQGEGKWRLDHYVHGAWVNGTMEWTQEILDKAEARARENGPTLRTFFSYEHARRRAMFRLRHSINNTRAILENYVDQYAKLEQAVMWEPPA